MLIHQNLEASGMEDYCSAGWSDRPHFKGQFEVERLIKSRWETFWDSTSLCGYLHICDFIACYCFCCVFEHGSLCEFPGDSGGETTKVRKDGSLGIDSQTGPVSGSNLLYPQVPNFGFRSCSPVQWQNKASTMWPAAQDVGTEFALVFLVQRDLHTSILQVLAKVPTDNKGSNIKPQPKKLSSNSTFFSSIW